MNQKFLERETYFSSPWRGRHISADPGEVGMLQLTLEKEACFS
jgi:hypothetical protein